MSSERAEQFKNLGNEAFKKHHYQEALEHYTAAIDEEPSASLYCNRAFANLRLQFSGEAIHDADLAIGLDAGFVKAYYRKATAFLQLGKHKEALKELRQASVIAPGDADIAQKLKETDKEYKRIQFLNAIASADSIPASQRVVIANISVPSNYDGPVLPEDGTFTPEFVRGVADYFKAQKLVGKRYVTQILLKALQVLKASPNVVTVPLSPDDEITVCGDTHGQFYDTLNIFEMNGWPSTTNRYLFNGDFVDRGSYSVENVVTLLAFKCLYPNHFFMSRGNHEGQGLNRVYGFEGEVKAKYDEMVYDIFQEVFNALPLAHVVGGKVFVVHGGLFSRDNVLIEDVQKVNRFRDIPDEGLMCDLMWADPQPARGRAPSKRGVGLSFGPDVTENFLRTNNLELVIRSHEVQEQGYAKMHNDKLITVFSAPNYCDQVGNRGAYIRFKGRDMTPQFTTFTHVQHPGKKPMAYSNLGFMGGM